MKKEYKEFRILTIKHKDGSIIYVAELGNSIYDRVGRKAGFAAMLTSQEFEKERSAEKWVEENLEGEVNI